MLLQCWSHATRLLRFARNDALNSSLRIEVLVVLHKGSPYLMIDHIFWKPLQERHCESSKGARGNLMKGLQLRNGESPIADKAFQRDCFAYGSQWQPLRCVGSLGSPYLCVSNNSAISWRTYSFSKTCLQTMQISKLAETGSRIAECGWRKFFYATLQERSSG